MRHGLNIGIFRTNRALAVKPMGGGAAMEATIQSLGAGDFAGQARIFQ